jgi:rare lipoprotein A (peptidoglycan hydrolase)
VSPNIIQRTVWLAGVTLIVAVAALAIARRDAGGGHKQLPGVVSFYTTRAAPYGPTAQHKRTACGEAFTKDTLGVAHPELPCGVKIYIRFHGKEVLTQVVDRGPYVPGREFDITKALADRLGLHGTQTIEWGYAR